MKRKLYNSLITWKNSPNRKPLILEGARQVGKTWLLMEFGKNEYENVVYVNCSDNAFAQSLFLNDLKPKRIIRDVIAYSGQPVVAGKTLLVFDEIQDAPKGITSLKYFCEDAPEFHIAVAGSLLGVIHHPGESYPVGKVNMLRLFPMTFEEFIWAKGNDALAKILADCDWASINVLGSMLQDMLRQYFYVGGMPEVVFNWVENEDVLQIRQIQNRILASYVNDISKHAGAQTERIRMVWNSIPSQLSKENKKFIYGAVKKGGRAKDFEIAIQWLVDAGLTYKIHRCKMPEIPLKLYEDFDAFKLYLLDVGLLGALSEAPPSLMIVNNQVFKEFKGSFTENYILQQMMPIRNLFVYYYSKEKSTQEIDFLVQKDTYLVPIEVKAEDNVKSKSFKQFITIDHADKHLKGVRCSILPYIDQGWMENIPLYNFHGYINSLSDAIIKGPDY